MFRREIRIVLTGGGTGGHVFPLLAVASELREYAQNFQIPLRMYYIGPLSGPFSAPAELFVEQGIEVREISAGSLTRSGIVGFFECIAGFFQGLWHLFFIMPDIVFSKGGYGALPVIMARCIYYIPLVIHESDAIPGTVNLKSARFASRIAISFAKSASYFPNEKTGLVGNPVRSSVVASGVDNVRAAHYFGFGADRKTILILGGSQGARVLNDAVLDVLPDLVKHYHVIHQCGLKNFAEVRQEAHMMLASIPEGVEEHYKLYGFLEKENLPMAYAAADLVVARAGAGLIFELAALGKPAILVPLASSSQDHQRENAYQYAASGAATVVEEENLKPHLFTATIAKLLNDSAKLAVMSEAARRFARPDAAQAIARELLVLCGIKS